MKKKRRVPLTVSILVPLFILIVLGEVSLYLGAYFVFTDTLISHACRDDASDLGALDEYLSGNEYTMVGYGVTPVINAYKEHNPGASGFSPGSQEESDYYTAVSFASIGTLGSNLKNVLQRRGGTFVGLLYEDPEFNRMVVVGSSVDDMPDPEKPIPTYYRPKAGQICSAAVGVYYEKPAFFVDSGFFGVSASDSLLGATIISGYCLGDISHPTSGEGPFRIWLVRESLYSDIYSSVPLFTRSFAIVASILAVVLLVITYLLLRFVILRPAKRLADAGNAYIDSLKANAPYDVFHPTNNRFLNEMTDLHDALFFTQEAIRDYAKQVHDSAAYEERTKADLALAERIQMGMLPDAPLFTGKCSLHGYIRPAREVGGDMYNYFRIDEDRVGFFVGDVSGKGVPAALFMTKAEALLHLMAPELAINRVNDLLCEGNEELLFVTAFIGVFNFKTGLLRFVNCGHEPVFIYHDQEYSELQEDVNMALGCLEGFDFPVQERKLALGDRLFIYTDGISEAMDIDGNMFGRERILETLNKAKDLSGEEMLLEMQKSVAEFTKGAEQSDDMCMVDLNFIREKSLTFPATNEGLAQVPAFVDEFLEKDDETFRSVINVVLDDLCANVVNYGQVKDNKVLLVLRDDGKRVLVTIVDRGIPFDPTQDKPEHDPDQPGGLGILMAVEMTDEIRYRRIDDRNVLQFRKDR